MNKKDAELNFASFLFRPFFYPVRRFRVIKLFLENIFQKTLYLENGESDQKEVLNKKDAELNFASLYAEHFFDPIRRFGGIKLFLENISKKRSISKTVNRIKKNLYKKDAELNFASFLFRTSF